ncbi:2,3,4,5-tetrahydropyridine-2,6-dicarboxylate N-succinyltransferase [Buchnera aphidicola]|uniref:2,3,4,5-tetrahydropyridine-2,6-dicarboxylate N-succinyltransferase n=1 Tax=Buchnera aphidicola TaxID=9 RepID=UPI0031B6C108
MKNLEKIITETFENKKKIELLKKENSVINVINSVIELLNIGKLRISEKKEGVWITHQWLKKAVLLYLYTQKNKIIPNTNSNYYDKIPLRYHNYSLEKFQKEKVRVVPNATVRYGSFIEKNVILMPCYINIGSYIGENSMIDTWATVGSCAQIGKNVHLSGGVGIGGVLEPLQNNPTIIEDNCFIGARSEIVEGVIVEKNSVISMGVYIGQSTKIYDRETGKFFYGRIPSGSVVVPGNLPSLDNKYSLYSAIIVKKVDSKTRKKVQINELLRNLD